MLIWFPISNSTPVSISNYPKSISNYEIKHTQNDMGGKINNLINKYKVSYTKQMYYLLY